MSNLNSHVNASPRNAGDHADTTMHTTNGRGEDARPTARVIHASLVRPVLYLGVERHVIAMEGTVCLALVFGVGLSLATVVLILLVALVIHPVMVWVASTDPQATQIYVRSHAYADYYAPHAGLHTSERAPRPSVPAAR